MSKRDLANVSTDLAALANPLPSQRPAAPVPAAQPAATAPAPARRSPRREPVIQFSLSLRKPLRNAIATLARERDMTMRAFVLDAVRQQGVPVRDEDLTDMRKKE
jgi:hypothetical protein